MKSGTTSLHNYLNDHPNIFMSYEKEPNYFVDWSLSHRKPKTVRHWSEADYLAMFEPGEGCSVVGESSTSYTKMPGRYCDLRKLASFAHDPRFIYIMRDPVRRTISHYWWAVRFYAEKRGMLEAVQEEPHYRRVSHYAMQLSRYFDIFGRDRVLILTSEMMLADPVKTLQSVYDWLDVDSSHRPSNLMVQYRQTPSVIYQDRGLPGFAALRDSRLWRAARPYAPTWVRPLTGRIIRKEVTTQSIDTHATVRYLRSLQQEETMALCKMLDRDFPEWTTLHGEDP